MSDAPRSGQVVGGKYRVRQCLGTGGMGAVYEAENLATGKRVALKWLHPHLVNEPGHSERFMREARVLAKIRHPNVVDLYDVGRDQDSFFLVLEFLEGESLGARLDRGLAPIPETLRLLVDAMRGVAAAHKQGIIHRDLKPDNIFLARENDDGSLTPKLLDFGISKFAFPVTGQLKLTKTGSIFGTPRYMSFEQLMGSDVDARTDVYSFGVILYEALTGQPPYPASNFQQLIVQIGALRPPLPRSLRPEIPRELERVIMSALSQDRAQRPPNMEALIQATKPFCEPVITPPRPEVPRAQVPRASERRARPPREASPPPRAPWIPALVALAICASAAIGWMVASRDGDLRVPPSGPAGLPLVPETVAVASEAFVPSAAVPDAAVLTESAPVSPAPAALSTARLLPAPKPKPSPVPSVPTRTLDKPEPHRRRTPGMRADEF